MDSPPCDPADPPGEGDTGLLDLPEDCLGLILDLLDPVTVAILERVSKSLHTMIQAHQYWRKALIRMVNKHPYLSHRFESYYSYSQQRAPLNIKPQQSARAHVGRRGGEAEAGLQESVQVNMIFSFDNIPELIFPLFRGIAKELNTFWRKNDKYKPSTQRNCQYFCQRDDQQKIVSFL